MNMIWIKNILPFLGREEKFRFFLRLESKCMTKKADFLAHIIRNYIYYKFSCDISENARIAHTARFPHPLGIVIGDGVVIGEYCVIYQNVTIGQKKVLGIPKYPIIKQRCVIYPNCCVIGNITLNEGTIIGAGSVITHSTVKNGIYYSDAAKLKGKTK